MQELIIQNNLNKEKKQFRSTKGKIGYTVLKKNSVPCLCFFRFFRRRYFSCEDKIGCFVTFCQFYVIFQFLIIIIVKLNKYFFVHTSTSNSILFPILFFMKENFIEIIILKLLRENKRIFEQI